MNDTRIKYIIKVKQTVPLHELHRDDIEENPTGKYTQWAMSEDEALDEFHANIPIACLSEYANYLTEHLAIMTKLGDEMASYLTDKELEDYYDNCFEAGRDMYTIDVDDLWHIYQTVLYWNFLAGHEIDPQYKFVKGIK